MAAERDTVDRLVAAHLAGQVDRAFEERYYGYYGYPVYW